MICPSCGNNNPPEATNCAGCRQMLYRARLRVALPSGESHTYNLHPKNYRIGREPNNDIYIDDASVSRYHAEIRFSDNVFSIHDTRSKNGSLLNSENFGIRRLRDMDYVQLGNVVLHFREEEQAISPRLYTTEEFVREEFFSLSQKQDGGFATSDILAAMLKLALSLLHVERAFLYQQGHAKKLIFRAGCNAKGKPEPQPQLSDPELILCKEAANSGQLLSLQSDRRSFRPDGKQQESWQSLAFPVLAIKSEDRADDLFDTDATLGVCLFVSNSSRARLGPRKYELLKALMQQVSLTLHNELLTGEAAEKRRMKSELSLAQQIQQRLLPTEYPNIDDLEIISFFEPCAQISGDYFDVIPMSDNNIAVAIGDICGKGIPAALLSSTVKAAVRAQVEYTASPEQIISYLNRFLIQNTSDSIFLTLFFGVLDTASGELKYINAGHPPPILISENLEMNELTGTGPALGIIEPDFKQEKSTRFEPGDMLLMYTDGLIESQNGEKEIYGRQRFTEVARAIPDKKKSGESLLPNLVATIQQDVKTFIGGYKQADDLTFLALRRR